VVLEKHITKVPTMGDSITEGTIVEWMAQIGQKVEEEVRKRKHGPHETFLFGSGVGGRFLLL